MTDQNSNAAIDMTHDFAKEVSGNQFLTFMLGGEYYGVEILQVQEIKAWTPVTKVPNTPGFIKGVLNLRGEIVPILDMRVLFGLEQSDYTNLTVIIVLSLRDDSGKQRTIGVVADSVSDVADIADDNIKATPELGDEIKTDFIRNVANVEDKLVMLLDIMMLIDTSSLDAALSKTKAESEPDSSIDE